MAKVLKLDKSFWKNKKVFLTGHTGFKGSWMLYWLLKLGSEVCGYALPPEEKSLFNSLFKRDNYNFKNYYGDISNRDFLKETLNNFQPDVVFHFAAQPLVIESYLKPIETWETNVMGTLNLLEGLKLFKKKCAVVIITTDKVYKNKEWEHGYRENDNLGGNDPYSASKAATEILVDSWRKSFVGNFKHQTSNLFIATARSGNVIGGGDWSSNRLVPDVMKSLSCGKEIIIRNPKSTRPWQHVLEPLRGYLLLAENLLNKPNTSFCEAFNFGPQLDSNREVIQLIEEIFKYWRGTYIYDLKSDSVHEAKMLSLQIDKSFKLLNWKPLWDFEKTIEKTVFWYRNFYAGENPDDLCKKDLLSFSEEIY